MMMGAVAAGITWWLAGAQRTRSGRCRATTCASVVAACVDGVWALVLPVVIIGGMKFGVFTPTEAAVVAAVYAFVVGMFIYRELKFAPALRASGR